MDSAALASIRAAYDAVAPAYAERFLRELDGKPLDRALLGLFADMLRGAGLVVELGSGCGHVARYLHERGVDVLGVDISERSVELARRSHADRGVQFRQGDFFALDIPDGSLAGAVAFYAYVHLAPEDLPAAFREMARVLRPGAPALLGFHVGNERVHIEEWEGHRIDIDWHFLPVATVVAALEGAGLVVEARVERAPYEQEHPTTRGYVLARSRR